MNNRPETLVEFTGQTSLVENLKMFIQAAKGRAEALDHVLFHGPPGLGKTTLAQLISAEMGGRLVRTSAPILETPAALMSIVSGLEKGDVLFIDEIHRLPMQVEEILYTAMEDFRMDVLVGEGLDAKPVSIDLDRFTLVGATTRAGGLSKPLFDRFQITMRLEFYSVDDLVPIVKRAADKAGLYLDDAALVALASKCRGTPRTANRLMMRVRDFAAAFPRLSPEDLVKTALGRLGIVDLGLDAADVRYLEVLNQTGRPVGVATLAAALSETKESLEDVTEPFLLRMGLISRTSRGREITEKGVEFLSKCRPDQEDTHPVRFPDPRLSRDPVIA